MLYYNLQILNELIKAKEKKRLEKIEKEYIEKEIVNIDIIFISIDSSSFDFFDPFLFKLFETDFEVLLTNIDISNGMFIVFQNN